MSTPAQIGKNEYRAIVGNARCAKSDLRNTLRRIMQESREPVVKALVGQAALALGELDEAINRLDEIGRNTR